MHRVSGAFCKINLSNTRVESFWDIPLLILTAALVSSLALAYRRISQRHASVRNASWRAYSDLLFSATAMLLSLSTRHIQYFCRKSSESISSSSSGCSRCCCSQAKDRIQLQLNFYQQLYYISLVQRGNTRIRGVDEHRACSQICTWRVGYYYVLFDLWCMQQVQYSRKQCQWAEM